MNQAIVDKLEAITAGYDERAARLAASVEDGSTAQAAAWADFTRLRDQTILPAAEEVAERLRKLGHETAVRVYDPPAQGGEHHERAQIRLYVRPAGGEPATMAFTYSRDSASRTLLTLIELPLRSYAGPSFKFQHLTTEVIEAALVDFAAEAFHPRLVVP